MSRIHPACPAEFRCQMVELVRSGRPPSSLAEEFEPSASAIRTWVKQADLDQGLREDGLTTVERDKLRHLKRENHRLREERDTSRKEPRAGSLGKPTRFRQGLQVRERAPGRVFGPPTLSRLGSSAPGLVRRRIKG